MKTNIGISLEHALIMKMSGKKSVYHIDDQIFASVLSHLNFTLYSDQTTIMFKLPGIRGGILGIVTFLLGSPGWY